MNANHKESTQSPAARLPRSKAALIALSSSTALALLITLAISADWPVLADPSDPSAAENDQANSAAQAQMGDDLEGDEGDSGDAEVTGDNQPSIYADEALVERNEPSRFMWVLLPGDSRAVKIRPIEIKNRDGIPYDDANESVFRLSNSVEAEWPGTRRVRRYTFWGWAHVFEKYLQEGYAGKARLIYQRLGRSETDSILLNELNIQLLPQTWENIWQRMVEGSPDNPVPVDQRIERVREFSINFDEVIQNKKANSEYFSPEERNAFNQFYYQQFSIALDRNPRDPTVYEDLAEYFRLRNKVDALLTVYLDAIRNEVPEEYRFKFHLKIGEAMVDRLQLWEAAIPHLERAGQVYADARLLLIQCFEALERYDEARAAALDLVAAIDAAGKFAGPVMPGSGEEDSGDAEDSESGDNTPTESDATDGQLLFLEDEDTIRNRALLYKARANITSYFGDSAQTSPFESAFITLQEVPYDDSLERDEADYLLASMYSYRNQARNKLGRSDADVAISIVSGQDLKVSLGNGREQTIKGNARFAQVLQAAGNPNPDLSEIPYDPLGCKALCVWAQSRGANSLGSEVPSDILNVLNYAANLDPLSAEPMLVRGQLHEQTGEWRKALAAYEAGLAIAPDEARLNYQIGMLQLAAGDISEAESRFRSVLRSAPRFYAAMNQLGRIELARSEDLVAQYSRLLRSDYLESEAAAIRQQMRALGDEIVAALQQARAFFSSSLNLNPEQNAVRSVLASLYTQVAVRSADTSQDQAVAYLESARDLAGQVIAAVRDYGSDEAVEARQARGQTRPSDVASAPPMQAYTIKAYACYELWRLTDRDDLRIEALLTLEELAIVGNSSNYYPNTKAYSTFVVSYDMQMAMDTLARMRANERQKRKADRFEGPGRSAVGADNLTNNWGVRGNLKPDTSFYDQTRIADGKLVLNVEQQNEAGIVSRISRVERFSQLASFTATFDKLGAGGFDRGVHFTTQEVGSQPGEPAKEIWSILVGFTKFNEPYYDVRVVEEDENETLVERSVLRRVIDPNLTGAILDPDAPITINLERRVPERNGSVVVYSLRFNDGRRIRLALDEMNYDSPEMFDDPGRMTATTTVGNGLEVETYQLLVGFWVEAPKGSKATTSIDRCEWVLDSELAQRDDD